MKQEAQQLNIQVKTLYRATNDITKEITTQANRGKYDLLLVGGSRSLFTADVLGGKVKNYLEDAQCQVGVLVDKDFTIANRILVPLQDNSDLFLISFAERFINDHIIEVLDMGRLDNNDRFMVMEYLDGETLDQRCERLGVITEVDLYPIIRQLLTGLSAAHQAGIVHRDLKPDNIFILQHKAGHRDFVKIIDFRISKFTAGAANFRMTMTGAIMGTPYYMAPEQAKGGKNVDIRSDVYAVGVVMFRALTGQVPFQADSFNELIFKIALSDTPQVQHLVPYVDVGLNAIVQRAMARNTEDRYQNAQQFRDALDLWAEGRGVAVPGRVTQTSVVERQLPVYAEGGTLATEPAPANTHVPWSNSGIAQPGGRGRLWALGGVVVVGAAAVFMFGGEAKQPATDITQTAGSAQGPSGQVAAAQQPQLPAPAPSQVGVVASALSASAPPTSGANQELAASAPVAFTVPDPSPNGAAGATGQVPLPAVVHAASPRPRPVAKPVAPAVARPEPAEPKPPSKPSAKPKPKDMFGY